MTYKVSSRYSYLVILDCKHTVRSDTEYIDIQSDKSIRGQEFRIVKKDDRRQQQQKQQDEEYNGCESITRVSRLITSEWWEPYFIKSSLEGSSFNETSSKVQVIDYLCIFSFNVVPIWEAGSSLHCNRINSYMEYRISVHLRHSIPEI